MVKRNIQILLLLLFVLLSAPQLMAQKSKIKLVKAKELVFDKKLGADVQRIRGDAVFKHKTTTLYCDSAYLYGNSNSVKAYGSVHINDNDSVHIYSDSLYYDGETRLANLYGDIRMVDQRMTLTTNNLTYDLNERKGYYFGGGKIVDQSNELVSQSGIYYSSTKDIYFKQDVVLTNPEYIIECDTLIYNTQTELARFHGPTTITSEENLIYCERGWYNTQTDLSEFSINAYLENKSQKIAGDEMFYDRNRDFGRAKNNVVLTDTSNKLTVFSQYIEYRGEESYVISVDSNLAIVEDEDADSAFLHADTLILHFDSLQEARLLLCFHKTQLYKSDLQAICDSLVYSFEDSLIQLFTDPILWSGNSQLTGEFMEIHTDGESPERMDIKSDAFILSLDSMEFYNQISGRDMVGHFRENTLTRLDVFGNAESLYFARDEEKELIGVDISVGSDLKIRIAEEQIDEIIYYDEPTGTIYPLDDLSPNDLKMKGYVDYDYARPKSKNDVFFWRLK
jgi:lipopolysaccharide export system protein LptA